MLAIATTSAPLRNPLLELIWGFTEESPTYPCRPFTVLYKKAISLEEADRKNFSRKSVRGNAICC